MRLVVVIALLAAAAATAGAKPLPAGMKVVLTKDRPMVTQGGISVPLLDNEHLGHADTIKGSLSDDGATLQVTWGRCGMIGDEDSTYEVPFAHVKARLENTTGMGFHRKRKYADAIAHFTAAAAANPDEPVFATNLLSAQAMAGKLDDADHTIATYAPRHPWWFAWRLAVDLELKAVKARPAAVALAPARPGKARVADLAKAVAFSAIGHGLVAMLSNNGDGGPGSPIGDELLIYDLGSQREVLRLPVETMEDACSDAAPGADGSSDVMISRCTKGQRAATAAHTRAADAFLAAAGFDVLPGAMIEIPLGGDDKVEVKAPDGKSRVVVTSGNLHVTAGGKTFDYDRGGERIDNVVFVRDQVLLEYSDRHIYYCDDDSFRTGLELAAPQAAPPP